MSMVIRPYTEKLAEVSSDIENASPKAKIQAHPRSHHGSTPLLLAAGAGHTCLVKLLLARDDVSMSMIDDDGDTSMMCAEPGRKRIATTRRTLLKLLECKRIEHKSCI